MFNINYKSQRPLYEQIIEQTVMFMVEGILKTGDQMPSVREMASTLGINPNTVQKAYGELERRGFTQTVVGKGTFISSIDDITEDLQQNFKESIRLIFDEMLRVGISKDTIAITVQSILKEEDYATNTES